MKPITMSRLPIVARCPASWALPHVEEAEASEPAKRGTAIHAFLADVSQHGRDAALDRVPDEYREACELIDTDRLPTHLAAEVSFRLNLEKGAARELGRDIGRQYAADRSDWTPACIDGTADLVGIDEEADAVVVYDYKSGWSPQDAAADHWQIGALALAAARAYDRSNARIGIIRLWETGHVTYDVATLDAFDLNRIEVDLCAALDRRADAILLIEEGRTPTVTTGRHCRYCPAFFACPAQVGLVRQVAAAPEALDAEIAALLTPENAAKAYHRIVEVQMVLDRVTKQVKALAEQTPIPLGNNRMLGLVEKKRETIVGDVALPVLKEHYGEDVAEAAAEVSITKTRLRDALKGYAQRTGGKIAHLEKEALKLLRANSGVEVSTSRTVAEYELKVDILPAGRGAA